MADRARYRGMIVHLIDGTYELFRHFYGFRRSKLPDQPLGAVSGVLGTIVQMLEEGATHIGVATDHVIESFRNDLWPGYKTGEGIDPALWAQFHPLEESLVAMGVTTWPMVELEADDALASAAHLAALDHAGREGVHLDARQGSRAVRHRRSRRPGRSPERRDSRRRARAGEVRGRAVVHPRLSRARRRRGRRLSGHPGHRQRKPPRASSRSTATSSSFPRASSARTASARCSSRRSRRCAPTRRSSTDVGAAAVEGRDAGISHLRLRSLATRGWQRE